jgi:hypothetical protein
MKRFDIKAILEEEISKIGLGWDIKGVIDSQKRIYTRVAKFRGLK